MAVSMIGPKFYAWDKDGKPLAGGLVYTYQARTNIPKPTYQSEDGITANSNPVVLNSAGYADIYLDGAYKIVVKDKSGKEIWTEDPVTAQGQTTSEWLPAQSATYVDADTFTVAGNQVEFLTEGRALKLKGDTFSYAHVVDATYSGGNTFVNVDSESALTADLATASLGVVSLQSEPKKPGRVYSKPTIEGVTALNPATLTESDVFEVATGAGEGKWRVTKADISTEVTNDPLGGIYRPWDGTTGSEGGLVRIDFDCVKPQFWGAVNSRGTDSGPALAAAFASGYEVHIPNGDYDSSIFLNASTATVRGDGTQRTKLFYTGDPLVAGTFFTWSSGAVLKDFRIFGPFSSTQDVNNKLIGFAPQSSANRSYLQNIRAESFGTNFYFYKTQNTETHGLFAQYAKYAEFHYDEVENHWAFASNSNSSLQVGLAPDADYRLIRLEGNRNLQFFGGIHERATGADDPYLIDGGAAVFRGVEFNGTANGRCWVAQNNSDIVLDRCYWTLSGAGELIVETDATSLAQVIAPVLSGASGNHAYNLTKGRVSAGPGDAAVTLIGDKPLSSFSNSAGGAGEITGGVLVVRGASPSQGVNMFDSYSNQAFRKKADDGIASCIVEVACTALNGASKVNVYLPATQALGWRVKVGEITAPGVYRFPYVPVTDVTLSTIQLGVEWDGVTVNPTYGNFGLATIVGRSIKLFRS